MAQATVGALRITLGANTAQYEAGMRRAQATARQTGQSISTSMQRAQLATVTSFRRITNAAAGLGLAVGAASFVQAGISALNYASQLGETAQQIGVTVEQLQILSRIALQNGASQETLERSIQRLNRTLGEARSGVEASARIFTALGFTREQIDSWSQAGDAIRPIAERLNEFSDSSVRAAAEVRLFGRAGQQLDPTLQAIATGYDEAAAEAVRLGLITTDQARRSDEAKDAIDAFALSLRTRLGSALADNVDGIRELIGWIEALINKLQQASQFLAQARLRIAELEDAGNTGILESLGLRANPDAERMNRLRRATAGPGLIEQTLQRVAGIAAGALRPRGGGPELDLSTPSGGGGGGRSDDSERLREEALRAEAEFQSNLRRFRADLLRAQQEQVTDVVARSQIDEQILDIEREQYVADQELAVQLGDLTDARRQQLLAAHDAVDQEQRQAISLQRSREIAEENVQIDENRFRLSADALQQEAELADTAAERREVEMRLLELSYRHEAARLKTIIADEASSRVAVQEAEARLKALDNWREMEAQIIRTRTQGPLESFLDRLPTTAAKANEALEQVAANGLQAIEDGIVSILDGTSSVADAFRDMATSIISDLLRIQIQRMITIPLANAIGGGGDMSWLSSLLNIGASAVGGGVKVPTKGFASGGMIRVGGFGGIDRNLLSLNGMPIARVSHGEDIGVTPRGRFTDQRPVNVYLTAPNTGNRVRDTHSALQQAAMVRDAVGRASRNGY